MYAEQLCGHPLVVCLARVSNELAEPRRDNEVVVHYPDPAHGPGGD